MPGNTFFFAAGGTGGHIYPGIAVARKITELQKEAKIHFLCSSKEIDAHIISPTGCQYTAMPATGLSFKLGKIVRFCRTFLQSRRKAKQILQDAENPVVLGIGGFVAAPVCYAAHKMSIPVALLNLDIIPGKANRFIGRFADEIFVQFDETSEYFKKRKAKLSVTGCPLRKQFLNPSPDQAIARLGLEKDKKILLITGASSGSQSINQTVCSILPKLDNYIDQWQIVHLTGRANFQKVCEQYNQTKIAHKVLPYYDEMADLLSAVDLLIGRSGAVSIAEYAAAGTPSICMPYPHHKDLHQYRNAGKLVQAGAAIIVDDLPEETERADWLWQELEGLLKNEKTRREMSQACRKLADTNAASVIAEKLLKMSRKKCQNKTPK